MSEGLKPWVGVVMGSTSDWETMQHSVAILEKYGIPHEKKVVSAHRTPELLREYAQSAELRGLHCIIAGAGGAAHLPGMLASMTIVPVLGVPVKSSILSGVDSLYSIVQMPAGIPVATFAIGEAGAKNAALFAMAMIARNSSSFAAVLHKFRLEQTTTVLEATLPPPPKG